MVPWNHSFSETAMCNFLGKTRKTVKCIGRRIRKTGIIVDKNRKTVKIGENPQTAQNTKTEKPQFSLKPKNRTKNRPNPQNRKSQRPPPSLLAIHIFFQHIQRSLFIVIYFFIVITFLIGISLRVFKFNGSLGNRYF